MFGGIGLLQGMIAALGAALFFGNVAALVRPPQTPRRDARTRTRQPRPTQTPAPTPAPPLRRGQAIVMATFGLVIFVWSVASLLTK